MNQVFISKLTEITLANLGDENFGVNDLAREAGMSLYHVSTKLKAITNKTISQFIRETRLLKALEMLQNEGVTVSEVAYKVGFGSPTYFNTCFHEFFGYPPGEVKKRNFIIREERESVQIMRKQTSNRSVNRAGIKAFAGILLLSLFTFLAYHTLFTTTPVAKLGSSAFLYKKSIAVLPFRNLSDSTNNQYFIDGLMEQILTNLSKIHELRVISRTSVDQFRETGKSTKEIGKILNVDYIVEGSGQKYGNRFRLSVQLIETSTDSHIWAKPYDQEISETRDIFNIQSQIAQAIARELEAKITPEEKQLIEKASTTNLTALDFYQRGQEEYEKYADEPENKLWLQKANSMYRKALESDSAFALAYTGLADVYWSSHFENEFLSVNYVDSVPILCDIALSFDNKLPEAHYLKGEYYYATGKPEEAMKEYDKAIEYNPNDANSYIGKALLYDNYYYDYINAIHNYEKAISYHRGRSLLALLTIIRYPYLKAGFIEEARHYTQEAFRFSGDTISYYYNLSEIESLSGNDSISIKYLEKGYSIDSNNITVLVLLGSAYTDLHQPAVAMKYFKKCIERDTSVGVIFSSGYYCSVGFAYLQNGNKEKAEYYFNKQIEISNRLIELHRSTYQEQSGKYLTLAYVYSAMGEKEKALKNLEIYNQRKVMSLWDVYAFRHSPLFDNIRDDPEFRKIVNDIESKYMAQHERARKWLVAQGKI